MAEEVRLGPALTQLASLEGDGHASECSRGSYNPVLPFMVTPPHSVWQQRAERSAKTRSEEEPGRWLSMSRCPTRGATRSDEERQRWNECTSGRPREHKCTHCVHRIIVHTSCTRECTRTLQRLPWSSTKFGRRRGSSAGRGCLAPRLQDRPRVWRRTCCDCNRTVSEQNRAEKTIQTKQSRENNEVDTVGNAAKGRERRAVATFTRLKRWPRP